VLGPVVGAAVLGDGLGEVERVIAVAELGERLLVAVERGLARLDLGVEEDVILTRVVAPVRVLAGLNMPAVLFEMGYLTNPDQEKRATADDGRSVLVQAIYDAVNRFALAEAGGK
jgi:hypothetical protein